MKNITKNIISTILIFALVAGCFAALPLTANAAAAPVAGDPAWNKAYSGVAAQLSPSSGPAADIPNNPRNNASGDKISSNAHSADYPGLYFYWDDKQKDNGTLLVKAEIFDLFVNGEFILTAKNSNNYWGYTISKATGTSLKDKGLTNDDIYAFGIPKQIQYLDSKGKKQTEDLKNINMVFIDGQYKSAWVLLTKTWHNEEGQLIKSISENIELNKQLKFSSGLHLGINEEDFSEIKITDFATAAAGKKVDITETAKPSGFELTSADIRYNTGKDSKQITGGVQLTLRPGDMAAVHFKNQKQYATITIAKLWEYADGTVTCVAPDGVTATFNFRGNVAPPVETTYGPNTLVGTYKVKEGIYTIEENTIDGYDLICIKGTPNSDVDTRTAIIDVKAGGKYPVTFVNQEIVQQPMAQLLIIENWCIDDTIVVSDNDHYDEDIAGLFAVNGAAYVYDRNFHDIAAGEINIADFLNGAGDWKLASVLFIDGTADPVELITQVISDVDPYGFPIADIFTFNAEAGHTYTIVFTNTLDVQGPAEYYVSVVSGADFGSEVIDRWTWTNYGGGSGTINDYWNAWINGEGFPGYSDMLRIASGVNAIDYYIDDVLPKDLLWVWGKEDGITICWETQADVIHSEAGDVVNPMYPNGGPNEYYRDFCEFTIDGNEITYLSHLYFAADNAIELYINGHFVRLSEAALDDIDGDWKDVHDFRIYMVNSDDYEQFLIFGLNTVSWVARNDNKTPMEYNPCGILLAFEIVSK